MFSDSRGALMRRHKFKVSTLHKKCKKERPSENIELTGKPFEAAAQKKEQENSRPCTNEPVERKSSESN